jgi:uncharacterized membrane protein
MTNNHVAEELNDTVDIATEDVYSSDDDLFNDSIYLIETRITADDKLWSAIGYLLPIFAIIALMRDDKKERPFIKYHAVQAIALSIVLWALILIVSIATFLFGSFCAPLFWLLTLWPSFDAYKGNYTKIPYVTAIIKKRDWV